MLQPCTASIAYKASHVGTEIGNLSYVMFRLFFVHPVAYIQSLPKSLRD